MTRSRLFVLFGTAIAALLLPYAPLLQAGPPAAKPIKISWSVSRLENADVAGGIATVEFTPDGTASGATLGTSASLNNFISLPPGPFDLVANTPISIDIQVLMTPDEAGQTIGGTIHVYLEGKNLAKPLPVSLQQTASEEEDGEESGEAEETGGNAKSGVISWSDGAAAPLDALTLALLEGGPAQIVFTPSQDLADIRLWPTPSLSKCLDAVVSPSNVAQPDVLEIDPDGDIVLVTAGTPVLIDVALLVPPDQIGGGCGGTLHVRNTGKPPRTWPTPLNVRIGAAEEQGQEVVPSAAVGAASFQIEPIAPGQIISVFGSGLGPNQNAVSQPANGAIAEHLAGTMVFFDGVPARVLSANNNQVNVIVPQELEGTEVELLVVRSGFQSTPFPLPLQAVSPELFTLTGEGRGQVAAFNSDGTLNRASNPAAQGSWMILFGTGAGATEPALADGEIATEALPLAATIEISVGGVPANVTYAGTSPGQVGALTQFNIELGPGTPSGQQPVKLVVNGVASRQKATVAVE